MIGVAFFTSVWGKLFKLGDNLDEEVLYCRSCGNINPKEDTIRCEVCDSFSALLGMTRGDAERTALFRRIRFLRSRTVRIGIPLVIVLTLTIWYTVEFFNLGFDPPRPSTALSAGSGPMTWAQGRRTAENSGFTPDQAPTPGGVRWSITSPSHPMQTPTVVGNTLYVGTEDGRALALDRETGAVIWEHDEGVPAGSSAVVVEDLVIFGFRPGPVIAFNRSTGEIVWRDDLRSPIYAGPLVADGVLFLGAGDSQLHAIDVVDGTELWTFSTDDWVVASAAYTEDTVVLASQSSRVDVIDAKTGRGLLYYDTGANRFGTGPVVYGDRVLLTSDGGLLWAIDRLAQSYPLERAWWKVKINLYVWQIISGRPLQKGSIWSRRLGGSITTNPAVAYDQVYVTNKQGKVFARSMDNGDPRWTTDLDKEISTGPTVAGNTVLVGTEGGLVVGLDAHSGEVQWEYDVGAAVARSPVVVDGSIYVVTVDGRLLALDGGR